MVFFWKDRLQIEDILDPEGRDERKRIALAAASNRGRGRRGAMADDDDDFGEAELDLIGTTISEWSPQEDQVLRDNYAAYQDSGCHLEALEALLEENCNTS